MAFNRTDAKNLGLEIVHSTGIVADLWHIVPLRGCNAERRNYYLVLRDPESTEIAHRHEWHQYQTDHPERIRAPADPQHQ